MKENTSQARPPRADKKIIPVVSLAERPNEMIELVFDPKSDRVCFSRWDGHKAREVNSISPDDKHRYVPIGSARALIRHNVVRFASAPEEYESEAHLIDAILAYLRRYVALSESFARVAANYVLLTWVYDRFNELPYLRRRGDYGTGKTRFLITLGSICYKPIFAGGASTVSPIFHLLDQIGGTLIMDEADFRFSDESAQIAKILNNGNERGFSVLRSETVQGKEFQPRAFKVFGPKVVAMRGRYEDAALESRFLSETSMGGELPSDIPINLPPRQEAEALHLRNMLLMYRFRNFAHAGAIEPLTEAPHFEARLKQTLGPLLAIAPDETSRQAILAHGEMAQSAISETRGQSVEAEVVTVLRYLMEGGDGASPSIKEIARTHGAAFGTEGRIGHSAKAMGAIVRTRLNLATRKSHGVYVVSATGDALTHLYRLYRITAEDVERLRETLGADRRESRVDFGEDGDLPVVS